MGYADSYKITLFENWVFRSNTFFPYEVLAGTFSVSRFAVSVRCGRMWGALRYPRSSLEVFKAGVDRFLVVLIGVHLRAISRETSFDQSADFADAKGTEHTRPSAVA